MLKNFGIWFVCFGLSFLAESFGLASQGAFQIMTFGQCLCTSKSQKD